MNRPKTSFPRQEHVDSDKRDQKNTIKLFIFDTRRKLSSGCERFATDSEKEVLFTILQETEDWLYEDSDDESEQDCTGKLEYIKKLLEPIENRYKEENARAKAVKAMQICIAKYRSLADSLPADQKEKVKDLCNRADHWLNDISQQHSSPKNSSSYINEAIEVFKSGCRSMLRPKPSYARHEPMDSNETDQRSTLELFIHDARSKLSGAYQHIATDSEKEVITNTLKETEDWLYQESKQDYTGKLEYLKKLLEPIENRYKEENARAEVVKTLQTCIAKYLSLADLLPACQKEEVTDLCNRAEHFLKKHSSPDSSSSYINEAMQVFESGCRSMMRLEPSYPRPELVDSNKRDQRSTLELFIHEARSKLSSAYQSLATDSDKEVITNILKETEDWLYNESEQVYSSKLEYLKKFLEPIENRYQEENARTKAVKALQTCIATYRSLADSLLAGKKEEVKNECNKAEMWLNRIVQRHSSSKNSSSYINQVIIDFESNCKYKMRPSKYDEPVVSNKTEQLANSNKTEQLAKSNKREQSIDSNRRERPVDLDK